MRHHLLAAKDEKFFLLATAWVGILADLIGEGGKCPPNKQWDLLAPNLYIDTVKVTSPIQAQLITYSLTLSIKHELACKLANDDAKKWPATGGVVDIRDEGRRARLMAITPINEVGGIGRALNKQLQAEGVATMADLITVPPKQIRQR